MDSAEATDSYGHSYVKSHRNKSVLNQRICKSGQDHKGGEEHSRKKDHHMQSTGRGP